MKRIISNLAAIAAATLFSTASWGVTFGDGGTALDGVLDGIATDGDIYVDVVADQVNDDMDSYWEIGGSGGAVSTVIIEIAALSETNSFGIYDRANSANMVELFAGTDGAGDQIVMTIMADGSVHLNFADTGVDFAGNNFGFYLNNPTDGFGGPATYYSDTDLNGDGVDHMAAYQGDDNEEIQIGGIAPGTWLSNEYILAWEDIYGGGDRDFTDFVVIIESITPVPEPSVLALLGLGILGMGFARRRRS